MDDKFINKLIVATVAILVFSWFLSSDVKKFEEQKSQRQYSPQVNFQNSEQAAEQSLTRLNRQILIDKHNYDFCKDISIDEIKQAETVYYQWIDSNGQLQVSDKKPEGVRSTKIVKKHKVEKFQLNIVDDSNVLPQKIRGKLEAGLRRIYRIYGDMIPAEKLKNAEVNIYIFSDREKYRAHASTMRSDLDELTDGFYYKPTNQAVVFYRNLDQVLDVSLHEATHLINATVLGMTPRWLNEGLAEYFERMRVFNQATVIEKATGWPRYIEQQPLTFSRLINGSDLQWSGDQRGFLYAHAWAFVYFMMDDRMRRKWFANYLSAMAGDYCKPFSHADWFEKKYKGGISSLDEQWQAWLSRGLGKVSHQY